MPELVKSVFINSLKNELILKEKQSKEIMINYAQKATLKDANLLLEMTDELIKLYEMEMISSYIKKQVQERYKKYYDDAGSSKRAGFWLNQVFAGSSLATSLFLSFGFEISRNCIEFKSSIITSTILQNDLQIFKTIPNQSEEEKEKEKEVKIEIKEEEEKKEEKPDNEELTGKVQSIICKIDHKNNDAEYLVEKSIENILIEVDTEIVRNVINSLKNFAYQPNLFFQRVDLLQGTKQFSKVWDAPPKPPRRQR